MKVTRILTLLAFVAIVAGMSSAKYKVLVVSDCQVPGVAGGNHNDDSLVAWLEEIGYEVDTSGMNQAFRDGNSPPRPGNATMAALEAADIVFVSRRTDSGSHDDGASRLAWNGLTTPLILNGNSAFIRGETSATRWGWTKGNHNTDNTSAVNWDLTAGGSITMFDWSTAQTAPNSPKGVGVFPVLSEIPVEGQVIATFNGASRAVWVKFPAGTNFDTANGTTNKYGVAGADRVFFGHFGYDGNFAPDGTAAQWSHYITDEYKATLKSVLSGYASLDPSFNPPPAVNAGVDQVGYVGSSMQLNATVTDEDPEDGSYQGTLTFEWIKRSGPGNATFVPADTTNVADPSVTFDAEGTYELLLQASDGIADGNDLVVITVIEAQLVGHWTFDGDVLDHGENAEKSNGTIVGVAKLTSDAAIGSGAIDLTDTLGLEAINPKDPNLPHVVLGAATGATELDFSVNDWTVCGWVKTTQVKGSGDLGKGTIFGNGGDTGGGHRYCMIHSEGGAGRVTLVTDNDVNKYTAETSSSPRVDDGRWHHIVGQRVGNEIYIYRDGILGGSTMDGANPADLPAGYNLSGTSQAPSYIGVITDYDATNPTIYKHLNGLVDDVRVYNYALEEADILDLVAGVELLVSVYAGPDQTLNLKKGESVPTEATAIDNGIPGELNYTWETVTRPGDEDAVFANPNALNTTVTFPDFGVYTLRLSVEDDNLGTWVSDEVTFDIVSPTCADVISQGLLMAGDISGPDGTPDCRVDLSDVAAMAIDWLRCVDPQDLTGHCEDPWNGGV